MVRNYKRKSKRGAWTQENMQAAINAVRAGQCGFKKAARDHGVPRTTLKRKFTKLMGKPVQVDKVRFPASHLSHI